MMIIDSNYNVKKIIIDKKRLTTGDAAPTSADKCKAQELRS
jgi:hypothetical protein